MIRCLLCLLAVAAPLQAQEPASADAVLKLHDTRTAGMKSWQANFAKAIAQGTNVIMQTGTVRLARLPDGGEKGRADFLMQVAGRELNYRIIAGDDGVVWQLVSQGNRTGIYKLDLNRPIEGSKESPRSVNPINELNPASHLQKYRGQLDFALEAPQTLAGRRLHQLAGKPKVAAGVSQLPFGSIRFWVGAEDGFIYRIAIADLRGAPMLVLELSGLKTNLNLEDGLFIYAPPEGANVLDLNARLGQRPH
ncbi:MAG: hypothetical protein HZA91_16515 [Verrucomicrobia bacterium]|nr:hypothetical protein [Verrucomicrobiota bacterium]